MNSTKPLPKGLIYELLPVTGGELPSLLRTRRFPAFLLQRLNYDEDSPLRHMIRTATMTTGVVKDNSLLKMLENSLTDGVLYRFRDPLTGEGDYESMLRLLKNFWTAVSVVWDDAWNLPPRRSRLLHGVGVIAMGFLMDAIADRYSEANMPSAEVFVEHLQVLREVCRWTNGYWEFGPRAHRKWKELQNTAKDIRLLTNYLLAEYRARSWGDETSVARGE